MVSVRVLSGGVIAPYYQVADVFDFGTRLLCNLTNSSTLIKSRHRTEVIDGDRRRIV